jgi:hypothetical protein
MHSIFPEMELTPSEISSWESRRSEKKGLLSHQLMSWVADADRNSQSLSLVTSPTEVKNREGHE